MPIIIQASESLYRKYQEQEMVQSLTGKKEKLIPVKPSGVREKSQNEEIYEIVRQIPAGKVTTYGAIAKLLHLANPRMVGHALRVMDCDEVTLPVQRVVNASGRLSGDHPEHRRKLLIREGIQLKGDRIVDFEAVLWDPAKEM